MNKSKVAITLDDIIGSTVNSFPPSEVLRAVLECRKAERAAIALDRCTYWITAGECAVKVAVNELRRVRNAERVAKAHKDSIVRAVAYFGKTFNYLPLAVLTQGVHSARREAERLGLSGEDLEKALTIPADWDSGVDTSTVE